MPYPAYSGSAVLTAPTKVELYWGGTGTYERPSGYANVGNSASTNNPLRPDKTRAMAPFSRWGYRQYTSGRLDVTTYPGWFPGGWMRSSGSIPMLAIDPRALEVWSGGADKVILDAFSSWADRQVEYSDALRHAGETGRMVGDLSKGIARGLGDLFDKNAKGLKRRARNWKELPGWYLQYLYGWKPLADDVENAVDKLVEDIHFNDSLHVILQARWRGFDTKDFKHDVDVQVPGYDVWSRIRLEQRNSCSFRYDIPIELLPNLEPIGFFGTLWEGSPYSFVADWLAPIGSWLTALDVNALWPHFKEGSVSQLVRGTVLETWAEPWSNYTMSGGVIGRATIPQIFAFSRVLRGPNSLTARIPIRNPLSLNHAAQGLALLSSALKAHW